MLKTFARVACAVVMGLTSLGGPLLSRVPIASAAGEQVVPLAQINASQKGLNVVVQGSLIGSQNISTGFKLYMSDGTAMLPVSISENTFDQISWPVYIQNGAVLRVNGRVNVSRGQLELILMRGSNLTVVTRTQQLPRLYQLGAMNGNDHNAVVRVEGKVVYTIQDDAGLSFYLSDPTGVQLVTTRGVVARHLTVKTKLVQGQRLSVIGTVRASRVRPLEIAVTLPSDVQLADVPEPVRVLFP